MSQHFKSARPNRYLRYGLSLFAGILVCTELRAQSTSSQLIDTRVLRIQGPITDQTRQSVFDQTRSLKTNSTLPASLVVLINSAGGDGEAAIAIGRALRQHQAHVFVVGRCDSACVFILAGGVVRAGVPGALGVHAGRLTQTNAQGRITREIDARQNLNDSFRLTDFNSQARGYLREMGIGQGLLDVMLAHQTKSVYRLSLQEINHYQLYGVNPDYLNQFTNQYNKTVISHPIHQNQLASRVLSVPLKCRSKIGNDAAFVLCYQQVIQNHTNL
jgi:hypothetical protein